VAMESSRSPTSFPYQNYIKIRESEFCYKNLPNLTSCDTTNVFQKNWTINKNPPLFLFIHFMEHIVQKPLKFGIMGCHSNTCRRINNNLAFMENLLNVKKDEIIKICKSLKSLDYYKLCKTCSYKLKRGLYGIEKMAILTFLYEDGFNSVPIEISNLSTHNSTDPDQGSIDPIDQGSIDPIDQDQAIVIDKYEFIENEEDRTKKNKHIKNINEEVAKRITVVHQKIDFKHLKINTIVDILQELYPEFANSYAHRHLVYSRLVVMFFSDQKCDIDGAMIYKAFHLTRTFEKTNTILSELMERELTIREKLLIIQIINLTIEHDKTLKYDFYHLAKLENSLLFQSFKPPLKKPPLKKKFKNTRTKTECIIL